MKTAVMNLVHHGLVRSEYQGNAVLTWGALVLSVFLLLPGSCVNAADQAITGRKLLLRSTMGTTKFVVLSKDPSIGIAGSDPIGGADSSLTFGFGLTFSLPAGLWSTNSSTTLFKYRNVSAPDGVKVVKLKPGLLKAVGEYPFAVPNGPASIGVVLTLDGGTNTYCMLFSGTGDGVKFLAKDAVAAPCHPKAPTCNNVGDSCGACPGGGLCLGNCPEDGMGSCISNYTSIGCINDHDCAEDEDCVSARLGTDYCGGACVKPCK